ncbi:MAG: hypothetical protein ACQKBU_07170 [Verrucomicrobiales bacterium]
MKATSKFLVVLWGFGLLACERQEAPKAAVVDESQSSPSRTPPRVTIVDVDVAEGGDVAEGDDEVSAGDRLDQAIGATENGLKVAGEKTKHGVGVAVEKTGDALETAGVKTEEGLRKAGGATGRFLKKMGEKLEGASSDEAAEEGSR